MTFSTNMIPCELALPYIRKYCEQYETEPLITKFRTITSNSWTSPSGGRSKLAAHTILAERADFAPRNMQNILNGTQREIGFDTLDKLFCAMDMPMVWYEDKELEKYYWEGEVPPDLSKPVKCANPKCDGWFELNAYNTGQGRYQLYCTNNCRSNNWKHNNIESVKKNARERLREKYATDEEFRERSKAYAKEYYEKNKERRLQYARGYRQRKKDAQTKT